MNDQNIPVTRISSHRNPAGFVYAVVLVWNCESERIAEHFAGSFEIYAMFGEVGPSLDRVLFEFQQKSHTESDPGT
jgi:hypothetical protein